MDSLFGDMSLESSVGQDLFPVGQEPTQQSEPQPEPIPPSEPFNAVVNAIANPIGAAEEILSPANVSRSNIPLEWAVVGVCVVLLVWANSWMENRR